MKTLEMDQMEQIEGGSCGVAVGLAVAGAALTTGILIATGGTAAALVGFFGSRAIGVAGVINACSS